MTDQPAIDYVIDTNVWVLSSRAISTLTLEEIRCYRKALQWLKDFSTSANRLCVDADHRILVEYRNNIGQNTLAEQILNGLQRRPAPRIIRVPIQWAEEADPVALVPEALNILDRSDRKFAAVALAVEPHPPIINATDTDWAKAKDHLAAVGLTVEECCPDYIQAHLRA